MSRSSRVRWDAFISHASEDKEGFVRPLARALRQLGANVWFDEFSLTLGDSLSESIDRGLANSDYGVVVLSPAFLEKAWPKRELRGLVSREIGGKASILPIWHNLDYDAVAEFSPPLADKVAVKTASSTAQQIARQIMSVIKPTAYIDHYEDNATDELKAAIDDLQSELDHTNSRLEGFLCPVCGANLSTSQDIPLDPLQKHWGTLRAFECGHEILDGHTKWLCPADARFPTIDEFELEVMQQDNDGLPYTFACFPKPLTENASKVRLGGFVGPTKEKARQDTIEVFERMAKLAKTS